MDNDINKEIDDLLKKSTNTIKDIFFYTENILSNDNNKINILKEYFSYKHKSFELLLKAVESILKGTNNFYKYENLGYFSNIKKDIYYYVSSFSGFTPDFEYGSKNLRPLIMVLKFIYNIDKTKFESVITKDYQKAIYLYFMISFEINFTYQELTFFLNSDDRIIQNGALYYLINKLESLIQEKQFIEKRNENTTVLNNQISKEINSVSGILCDLTKNKKIELVIDYYFSINRDDEISRKLNNDLINFSSDISLSEIIKGRIEINNPYTFTKLIPLLSRNDLKDLFKIELFSWVKNDFNKTIWNEIKEKTLKALNDNNIHDFDELNNFKLFISDFDKQIRYSKYIKDCEKSEAIKFLIKA